jgi:hypothetical protein
MLWSTLGLLTLLSPLFARQSPTDAETEAPEIFSRVAVLGASVSAGYGLAAELQAEVDLGTILECALRAEPHSVVVAADSFFFTSPHTFGRRFLSKVEEANPTLVVALDYLFWFPFGPEPTEDARLAELEQGLTLLGELDCQLLIGDIPDISQALEGRGPFGIPLVTPDLLAAPETIVKLNERLHQWAKERGRVAIAPMGDFLARLRKGEALSVRSNAWPEGSLQTILQPDLLHPTAQGSIALALLALDSLASSCSAIPGDAIDWDAKSVQTRLMERTDVERAKKIEMQRRREERRKAREDHTLEPIR